MATTQHQPLLDGEESIKVSINRVYREAKAQSEKTHWVFFLGVANALFIAWSFGAIPQHVWIIFSVESLGLHFLRLRAVMHPKAMKISATEHQQMFRLLFLLEFCYVANYAILIYIVVLIFSPPWLTTAMTTHVFAMAWGIGNGPLLGAVILFGNKVILHDLDNTISIVIHLFPAIVMYTINWNYHAISTSWPSLFHRGSFLAANLDGDVNMWVIWSSSALCYLVWWLPYTLWLTFHGKDVPRKKDFDTCFKLNSQAPDKYGPDITLPIAYDTVFHFNMRETPIGKLIFVKTGRMCEESFQTKCQNHDFTKLEAITYMVFHLLIVLFSIMLSFICLLGPTWNGLVLVLAVGMSLYKGSSSYANYIQVANVLRSMK